MREELNRTRRELGQAERSLEGARTRVEELRVQTGDGALASNAESEASRLSSERDSLASNLSSVEHRLGNTSPTQQVEVYADYRYSERYVVRSGVLLGRGLLIDLGSGQPLVREALKSTPRFEDFIRDEHRAPGAPDLYITPHAPIFPTDESIRDELASGMIQALANVMDEPLSHHCDRFVRRARATAGADRLNAWVLTLSCRAQVGDAGALAEAEAEVRTATGLMMAKNAPDLAHFDDQPLDLGGLSSAALAPAPAKPVKRR